MDLERNQIEQLVRIVITEVVKVMGPELSGNSNCSCNGDCPCSNSQSSNEIPGGVSFSGRLLSEQRLNELSASGCLTVNLPTHCIVTPLAKDRAAELGIKFHFNSEEVIREVVETSHQKCLAIISGHCSQSEEKKLVETARSCGWKVRIETVIGRSFKDLADAVQSVNGLIQSGQCQRAIVLDENIFKISQLLSSDCTARPAVCWDDKSAVESRCQGDCNFLLISNRLLGLNMLGKIVRAWLKEE